LQTAREQRNAAVIEGLSGYVLGPGDEITIIAINLDEIANRPIRVGSDGEINLPLLGRVRAAGLTVEELEAELTDRAKVYLRNPDLAITVSSFQSQPVSVLGAVGAPGIVQLQGRKTLLEVISLAGGLRPDHGSRITITRREDYGSIPLPSAATQAGHSVAEVRVSGILEASRPEENILILPHDVITVSAAEVVYVMGQVRRPGGYTLGDRSNMSILQLLALAEGVSGTAREEDARIIRPVEGSTPIEVAVNLSDLLQGKIPDMPLEPQDILFVPDSFAKGALRRTVDAAISAVTGMVIYRGF
jgi:polysaccharide export outer membrane protein